MSINHIYSNVRIFPVISEYYLYRDIPVEMTDDNIDSTTGISSAESSAEQHHPRDIRAASQKLGPQARSQARFEFSDRGRVGPVGPIRFYTCLCVGETDFSWEESPTACARLSRVCVLRVPSTSMSSGCFLPEPIHPPIDLGDQSETIKVKIKASVEKEWFKIRAFRLLSWYPFTIKPPHLLSIRENYT